jgi:uncharacterized membrane protein YphA (DoxX/SURF4 family)
MAVLCVATAVVPRWGGPAFGVVLLLACLGDQMRLQPGVISVAFLMIAPAFGETGRSIARWHLCSLWIWAGIHKLMSPVWGVGGATFIATAMGVPQWSDFIAIVLPLCELGVGLTALWPKLWRLTAIGAPMLHLGIVISLSPLFADWNSSVWPWNIAVAVCAPLLFLGQKDNAQFPNRAVMAVAGVLLAYPALFYFGLVDAYPSHNLYSSNTASAKICPKAGGGCSTSYLDTWHELNVPFPPEPRLFRQSFEDRCHRGDVLVITGQRTRIQRTPSITTVVCK